MKEKLLINLFDYETAAAEKLSPTAYDYYASGGGDEITLRENHAAYERIKLNPRVLKDISKTDLAKTLFGQTTTMPILIAPTAFHRMADPEGEMATARAAAAAGVIMILSTLSTCSIESVAAATQGPLWFQLYFYKDRAATLSLIQRAESAGCQAIALTVDAQVWGRRERDVRNRFRLPKGLSMENMASLGKDSFPESDGSGLASYVTWQFDPTLNWKDVDWLCSKTRLPVLLKGVLHPGDAKIAVEHGAAGLIVSNHGGRQLDTVPSTIEALPAIADAVGDRLEVIIDGGIRRGTDVIKAIASGASAVGVGRPVIWGLAVNGEKGAGEVLKILHKELELAMRLCGCSSIADITADLLISGDKKTCIPEPQ